MYLKFTTYPSLSTCNSFLQICIHDYGHTVHRNTTPKKNCLWEKRDKSSADMMEKGKNIQKKKFLLFPQHFPKRK